MTDRCVCCGEVIPEGRMVCVLCENRVTAFGLVFCKQCEYYRCGLCTNYKGLYGHPKPDDYCSKGKRKGNEL